MMHYAQKCAKVSLNLHLTLDLILSFFLFLLSLYCQKHSGVARVVDLIGSGFDCPCLRCTSVSSSPCLPLSDMHLYC